MGIRRYSTVILTVLALSVSNTGCEKYLAVDPPFAQDAENYFNTKQDYELALIGAYDLLQGAYLNLWIGEMASDNSITGGESFIDGLGLQQINSMTHNAVNAQLQDVFRFNYAGIARTNFIMEYKDKTDFDGKEQVIGETRFLRAYYYFQLVKFFGDVPLIVDKRLGAEEVTETPRAPKAEVYAQIESDLIYAANNLAWNNPVKGKVEKGSALSLLGKVYLYQNKFSQAAVVLDDVINNGPYSLMANYEDLWFEVNEDNSETVFDVEYSNLEGGSYGCLICLEGFAAAGFQGIRAYQGPVYADGNSYNLPTADLYNSFDPADPRRDITVLDIEAFRNRQEYPDSITYDSIPGLHTGYYNNKYIKRQSELGLPDDDLTSPLNYKAMRYADVLLMAAEAHNRNNNDGPAITYLNEVRNRVGMPAINASGTQLTEAIWLERRFELSAEGFRFFDLVRTGQAGMKIDNFSIGKNELFPIPQVEIDLAGGNWTQNSGY